MYRPCFFTLFVTTNPALLLPICPACDKQLSEMNGRPLHVRQEQFQKESQYRNMLKDQIEENKKKKVTMAVVAGDIWLKEITGEITYSV